MPFCAQDGLNMVRFSWSLICVYLRTEDRLITFICPLSNPVLCTGIGHWQLVAYIMWENSFHDGLGTCTQAGICHLQLAPCESIELIESLYPAVWVTSNTVTLIVSNSYLTTLDICMQCRAAQLLLLHDSVSTAIALVLNKLYLIDYIFFVKEKSALVCMTVRGCKQRMQSVLLKSRGACFHEVEFRWII